MTRRQEEKQKAIHPFTFSPIQPKKEAL